MPIYEYQCEKCLHELEVLQKMSDDPLEDCPACAQPALRKLVSASVFRLKGGGWYETDFKSGSKKNLAGDNKNSDSGTAGGGDNSKKDGGKTAAGDKSSSKSTASADS
jgi:putative FmdB family regulatory protein